MGQYEIWLLLHMYCCGFLRQKRCGGSSNEYSEYSDLSEKFKYSEFYSRRQGNQHAKEKQKRNMLSFKEPIAWVLQSRIRRQRRRKRTDGAPKGTQRKSRYQGW
jgi:hypothetical protein